MIWGHWGPHRVGFGVIGVPLEVVLGSFLGDLGSFGSPLRWFWGLLG